MALEFAWYLQGFAMGSGIAIIVCTTIATRKRGPLMIFYLFRTNGDLYGMCRRKPREVIGLLDAGGLPVGIMTYNRKPRNWPKLERGQCVRRKFTMEAR